MISTNVPSSGRQRRVSLFEHEFIGGQQTPDAVSDVARGERGTGDVLDIIIELELCAVFLAGELRAPFLITHLSAVGFAIVHHFDLFHRAVFGQPDGVGDELVLANDLIKDEPAAAFDAPDLELEIAHADIAGLGDRIALFRGERDIRESEILVR